MRVHDKSIINELIKSRKSGYSIPDLVRIYKIPKTTVWHHVHSIALSSEQQKTLRSRQGGSVRRREVFLQEAVLKAKKLLDGESREFVLILSMLYWAEGSKKVCEFINSDGKMIRLYLYVIRNIFKVKAESIKITVRIFTGMDENKCLIYWSEITKIDKRHFIVRLNDGGTKCNTQYGMCRVTIRKGHTFLKLIHAIKNIIYDGIEVRL